MKLPGGGDLPFKAFLKVLFAEYAKDGIADCAAQVAYYLLFALFPFLFFLTTLTAYLPLGRSVEEILGRMHAFVPGAAADLVETHVRGLVTTTRPKLLTFGLVVALWSASRGVDAIRAALNRAYDVQERRPYWCVQLVALGTTTLGALLLLASVALLIAGGTAGYWLAGRLGISNAYHVVAGWLRWPITIMVIMLIAAMVYFVLPDVKQKFKYITPGSVTSTVLWLGATWAFGTYVSHFGSYNVTYGSIGSVVILLTWFYISSLVFLLGGAINVVLEHASQERTGAGKAPGERKEGDAPEASSMRPLPSPKQVLPI